MFINDTHKKADDLLKAGKPDEAILIYNDLINNVPGNADLYSDRGVAYLHLKNKVECFSDLNKAIDLDPEYAFRYACRAFAKNHFGDLDGAIEDYEISVRLDPEDAVAHNNLGLLLEQKGYMGEAQKRFELADKLSKMEDQLYSLIDEMEEKDHTDEVREESQINPEVQGKQTLAGLKKVMTSRSEFRAFLSFIKNGFRIK